MLNAVDVLERAISFSVDHWVFFAVVVVAIVFHRVARAPLPARAGKSAGATQSSELDSFLERVTKARPLIAGYLASAKGQKKDNVISFTFNDTYSADAVTNARELLESIAKETYGAPVTISVETTAPAPAKEKPMKEDPVLKAFQKHLGGEVVETRRTK
jgi:hypothetical protein